MDLYMIRRRTAWIADTVVVRPDPEPAAAQG